MNTTLKEETLGQRLKAARIRKNMAQEELAEAMLITKSMISYYENDHGDMKQSMIAELLMFLGLQLNTLSVELSRHLSWMLILLSFLSCLGPWMKRPGRLCWFR